MVESATIPVPDPGRKLIASPRHTVGLLLIQGGCGWGRLPAKQAQPWPEPGCSAPRDCAALRFHDRPGMGAGLVRMGRHP